MKSKLLSGMSTALVFTLFFSTSYANGDGHNVKLHVNDRWDDCALVLDASLTQSAFKKFTKQVGNIIYFHPLTSAKPLGVKNYDIGLAMGYSPIDDTDPAWNDTFSHPDSTHWLGDAISYPYLQARMGVTDRFDIGAYITKSFSANYGFLGVDIKYTFLNDTEQGLAVAVRASMVTLLGVEDMNLNVYGLDVLVSKDVSRFTPYLGLSGLLASGKETTSKVDLETENVLGVQGIIGATTYLSIVQLKTELNIAEVTTFSLQVGFGF